MPFLNGIFFRMAFFYKALFIYILLYRILPNFGQKVKEHWAIDKENRTG